MAKTLYVGNLSWNVDDNELARLVGTYAEVVSARVVTDRETGRSRGFGFVDVPDEASESVISALNGMDHEGRKLTVNEAKPRNERPRGNSRARGYDSRW
ncbi:MAG TPA: RNA-binding protein [Firmicutes bacterium]|nr:RNA-binding protein [Bacillota bacterium]